MAPSRRRTDDTEDDYRKLRGGGPFNGHTKWVVGVVSAGIVTVLGWLLANDRNGFDRRLNAVEAHVVAVETLTRTTQASQQSHDLQSEARWDEIKRTLSEIKADVKEVKQRR